MRRFLRTAALVATLAFGAMPAFADDAKAPDAVTPPSLGLILNDAPRYDCNPAIQSCRYAADCIAEGLTCVLNGTPCCSPYDCKGKFPNTTCQ